MAMLAVKVTVTGGCFWYLAHNMDLHEVVRSARVLDLRWASLAVVVMMWQVPLVGLRWGTIIDRLEHAAAPVGRWPIVAITSISTFFAQVVPAIAADSYRFWMLSRIRAGWRRALLSVAIDRGVGVLTLAAVGFASLLSPSALASFGGYRTLCLQVFGTILALALAGLLGARFAAPVLERWRYTQWAGKLAGAAHAVLLGFPSGAVIAGIALGVHCLAILAIWLLGLALNFGFSLVDAAVLFTVMLGAALVPVSIGGWGVRELAITALLDAYNVPFERSVVFSVSFGLVLLVAALPGAAVWTFYSPAARQGSGAAPSS
jgi:uncharacterized membrane protein YbhN (UPF0104 family)